MGIDVSVVVPVYNSEAFLPECVESLLGQTLRNVEFIFVDDGSTDRSAEILERYRQRDGRIKVIRQQNLHAGVARNTGMEAASGKYIIFPDSDDFFKPDMLRAAFRRAEDDRAEIVIFGFHMYDMCTGACRPYRLSSALPKGVFSLGEKEARVDERFFERCYSAAWNKLYLRSFIEKHGLRFQDLRKCNDMYFVQMSLILAERIRYLDRRLLYYRINNESSLQGSTSVGRENYIDCAVSVKKKAVETGRYHGPVKTLLDRYALRLVHLGAAGRPRYEEYRDYYSYAKQRLIPDLFDSPEDIARDPLASELYRSRDFAEFLCLRLRDAEENRISRENPEYRVGHAMLRFPRRVDRLLRRLRTPRPLRCQKKNADSGSRGDSQ